MEVSMKKLALAFSFFLIPIILQAHTFDKKKPTAETPKPTPPAEKKPCGCGK
jgi:hypothetical protein